MRNLEKFLNDKEDRFATVSLSSIDEVKNISGYSDLEKLNSPEKMDAFLSAEGKEMTDAELLKERIIGENNLMGVSFLSDGLEMANTVCRIIMQKQVEHKAIGTGFLIGFDLLMTNNHVIDDEDAAKSLHAEFEYEGSLEQAMKQSVCFELDPDRFFVTNSLLDYTIVAVKPQSINKPEKNISIYGYNELRPTNNKVIRGLPISIIQHPDGLPKMIGIRGSKVVKLNHHQVIYTTDTQRGSSGSPVTNDKWEVIALHRAGVPARNERGEIKLTKGGVYRGEQHKDFIKWIANEGVLIDKIMVHVYDKKMNPEQEKIKEKLLKHYLPPEEEKYEFPSF